MSSPLTAELTSFSFAIAFTKTLTLRGECGSSMTNIANSQYITIQIRHCQVLFDGSRRSEYVPSMGLVSSKTVRILGHSIDSGIIHAKDACQARDLRVGNRQEPGKALVPDPRSAVRRSLPFTPPAHRSRPRKRSFTPFVRLNPCTSRVLIRTTSFPASSICS